MHKCVCIIAKVHCFSNHMSSAGDVDDVSGFSNAMMHHAFIAQLVLLHNLKAQLR